MSDQKQTDDKAEDAVSDKQGAHFALEICFLLFIALLVIWAFFEATTYKIVSSRTPFVIMIPLLILIAAHARRMWAVRAKFSPGPRISSALKGGNPTFNKVVSFSGWMVALVITITVLGHIAGIFLFCFVLMYFVAGEKWKLALLASLGTTLFIYGVFEIAFNIEMYRGLVLRWFLGYRDF